MSDLAALKFRVWNNKSGKMWPVDKLIWDDNGRCQPAGGQSFLVYSDKDALMQWTGLLDVDGAEIFEGDIVGVLSSWTIEKVIYEPPCFKTDVGQLRCYDCKVIGNIFEHIYYSDMEIERVRQMLLTIGGDNFV